ncbi:MAG: glycerol kinase [Betaproteobacteria bacterium]|nr:glycerol kinase [Betaproteobacteria bacterium]
MKYVLVLDQGTTSSRAIVFDESGRIRGMAQRELRQIFPQSGWVEHDPEEIWRGQLACARMAIKRAGITAKRIAAIGIANQRETTVVWDRRTGVPVHNAIVWQDRRTAARCASLKRRGYSRLIAERTGLVVDPYFSATKLEWILNSIPGIRIHAERGELAFGTIDTWLVWRLSSGRLHVTDPSNAARTMLYDIHRGVWDQDLLRLFKIPASMLPRVMPSSHVHGESDARLLGAPIPIAGIAGDQQAALFGQGCVRPGMAKNTYGTGCFVLMNTGEKAARSKGGLLTTLTAQVGKRQYVLEGSVFMGGAVIQWLRDGLKIIRHSNQVEALASSIQDSGGVFLVPAFTGLGAPYWDPNARGTLVGMTRGTSSAHIARAALESIALQSAELLGIMQKESGIALRELRVDGGAASNNLLMQMQADLLGVPVVRPRILETTALGASYLAGLATGIWSNRMEIADQWQADARFEPRMPRPEASDKLGEWRRAVQRSLRWAV